MPCSYAFIVLTDSTAVDMSLTVASSSLFVHSLYAGDLPELAYNATLFAAVELYKSLRDILSGWQPGHPVIPLVRSGSFSVARCPALMASYARPGCT